MKTKLKASTNIANTLRNSFKHVGGQQNLTFKDIVSRKAIKSKPLKHIRQYHESGCFIACVAMLLHKSYDEVFKMVHPDKNINDIGIYARPGHGTVHAALTVDEQILRLPKLGIRVKPSIVRKISTIRRNNKTALIFIRWKNEPWCGHVIVYDGVKNKFLNPGCDKSWDINNSGRSNYYERQIHKVFYIK